MDSVINTDYLQSYADIYSDIVCDNFFRTKDSISGEEILDFTEIKQVNLFIIKKLMDEWKKEADKLKSPYFNYEKGEVKRALEDLLNVLSRNIRIEKKQFKPLVKEALMDTLYLIFSPYEFFYKELGNAKTIHEKSGFSRKKKFMRINNELYEAFTEKIGRVEEEVLNGEEARKYFNRVCEEINFEPEDPDPFIEKLSVIEPLYLQKLYKDMDVEATDQENIHVKNEPEETKKDQDTLNKKLTGSRSTLADELENEQANTVLNYHRKQKIDSIRKNISIQQKFMFVKELFRNDDKEFNQVIEYLDSCSDRNEALEYISNNYFNTNIWNEEDEPVVEFMTVVDKKFI